MHSIILVVVFTFITTVSAMVLLQWIVGKLYKLFKK